MLCQWKCRRFTTLATKVEAATRATTTQLAATTTATATRATTTTAAAADVDSSNRVWFWLCFYLVRFLGFWNWGLILRFSVAMFNFQLILKHLLSTIWSTNTHTHTHLGQLFNLNLKRLLEGWELKMDVLKWRLTANKYLQHLLALRLMLHTDTHTHT